MKKNKFTSYIFSCLGVAACFSLYSCGGNKEKNEKDIDTVNLAKYFLCDIKRNIEIMWKGEHLPFIGYDYTMVLGEMYLG